MPDNQPQPVKVLCIEDEQFISELYKRALEKQNYHVTIVRGGIEGLEQAKTNAYDIILLDIMIPDMLGITLLEKLRHETPGLKAKIIIATNLEQDQASREAIEKEADAYIIKAEITPKQLVSFLNTMKLN